MRLDETGVGLARLSGGQNLGRLPVGDAEGPVSVVFFPRPVNEGPLLPWLAEVPREDFGRVFAPARERTTPLAEFDLTEGESVSDVGVWFRGAALAYALLGDDGTGPIFVHAAGRTRLLGRGRAVEAMGRLGELTLVRWTRSGAPQLSLLDANLGPIELPGDVPAEGPPPNTLTFETSEPGVWGVALGRRVQFYRVEQSSLRSLGAVEGGLLLVHAGRTLLVSRREVVEVVFDGDTVTEQRVALDPDEP